MCPFKSEGAVSCSPPTLPPTSPDSLQSQTSGGSPSQWRSPRLGSLMRGLGPELRGRTPATVSPSCLGVIGPGLWVLTVPRLTRLPVMLRCLLSVFSCDHSFILLFRLFSKIKKVKREVTQSCPTLRDPRDCSLPGSSVHGIFQARALEWGAIAFSKIFSKISAP